MPRAKKPNNRSKAQARRRLREQRIETYVDEVKDALDARGHLSPAEQTEALTEIGEYIENVSLPDVPGHGWKKGRPR
jgi:hypothetical protein